MISRFCSGLLRRLSLKFIIVGLLFSTPFYADCLPKLARTLSPTDQRALFFLSNIATQAKIDHGAAWLDILTRERLYDLLGVELTLSQSEFSVTQFIEGFRDIDPEVSEFVDNHFGSKAPGYPNRGLRHAYLVFRRGRLIGFVFDDVFETIVREDNQSLPGSLNIPWKRTTVGIVVRDRYLGNPQTYDVVGLGVFSEAQRSSSGLAYRGSRGPLSEDFISRVMAQGGRWPAIRQGDRNVSGVSFR